MTTLKVGIAPYEQMKARTLAIARGTLKPGSGAPKIWFPSLESFARVLSPANRALLAMIVDKRPQSLAELATLSGRAKSNLSRTLHTLERYGMVTLTKGAKGRLVARVPYSDIVLDVPIRDDPRRSGDGLAA